MSPASFAGTAQTISFPAIQPLLSSQSTTLGATASSGLPVSYEIIAGQDIVSLVGNELTASGTSGSFTVIAKQSGDSTFDPALNVIQSSAIVASQPFVKIDANSSASHVLAIRADGTLWYWGNTAPSPQAVPVQIGADADWTQIATSGTACFAIKTDGTLWSWGTNNASGQLGRATLNTTPAQIGSESDWLAIAGGSTHVIALKSNGTLWTWGNNVSGQLGLGSSDSNSHSSPTQVGSDANWQTIDAASNFCIATKADGTLWAWGSNASGQLGNGATDSDPHSVPTKVGDLEDWDNVRGVSCGGSHVVVIKKDGTLWAWGNNGSGQLGIGSFTSSLTPTRIGSDTNWINVSAGSNSSLAIRTDHTLWAWGFNGQGVLGSGDISVNRNTPIQIGSDNDWSAVIASNTSSLGLKLNGALLSWGTNSNGQLGLVSALPLPFTSPTERFSKLATGSTHSLGIKTNGTLWAWGYNFNGQLGDQSNISRSNPVQVGSATDWIDISLGTNFSHGIRADGSLWGWGGNTGGQIGDGTTSSRSAPVRIGSANNWRSISTGASYVVALKMDGSLWAWGSNNSGQLGDGSVTDREVPVQIGTDSDWKSVSAGGLHVLALKTDGSLWAWGDNGSSQVGDGTTVDRLSPVQLGLNTNWTYVSAGATHSFALRDDGSLWAWGNNGMAALGMGLGVNRPVPTRVGTALDWKLVAASLTSTIALKNDGSLWGWGRNISGQLGERKGTTFFTSPTQIAPGMHWSSLAKISATGCNQFLLIATDDSGWGMGDNTYDKISQAGYNQRVPNYVHPAPSSQTLTFPDLPPLIVGKTVGLPATSSSGLPVSYIVAGSATLTTDNQLHVTNIGAVKVTAYQKGDVFWLPSDAIQKDGQSFAAPTVITDTATEIGASQIRVNGTVTANNALTTVTVEVHGTTTDEHFYVDATPATVTGTNATSVTAMVTGLQGGTTYYYVVKATNAAGSVYGTPRSVKTMGPTLSNLRLDSTSLTNGLTVSKSGSISVQASSSQGVSRIDFYNQGPEESTETLLGTDTDPQGGYSVFWNLESTPADGSYSLSIKAYDTLGNLTTLQRQVNLVLAPPIAPAFTSPANGITVSQPVQTLKGSSRPDSLLYFVQDGVGETATLTTGMDGNFSRTVTLHDELNTFQIYSQNRAGESPKATLNLTLDRTIPTPPLSLQATMITGGRISLTWTRPSGTVASYNVYRATTAFELPNQALKVNSAPVTGVSFQDTPTTDGTYYYRVSTINPAGVESELSAQVSVTRDTLAPVATAIQWTSDGWQQSGTNKLGIGRATVTVDVNEALIVPPFCSVTPAPGSPILITLQKVSELQYTGSFSITASTPSGPASVALVMRDLAGNKGTATGAGTSLWIDTAGPRIVGLTIEPGEVIKNNPVEPQTLTFTATLDEPVKTGTTPQLSYSLSQTAPASLPVTTIAPGADSLTWTATVALPTTAGQITEWLALSWAAADEFENTGTIIVPKHQFEIYQGDLPGLDSPLGLTAKSSPAGKIDLQWRSVEGAADYQIFRRPSGTGNFSPVNLSGNALAYSDLPATDGSYDYAVAAIRQYEAETSVGEYSNIATAASDRVPPGAPSNLKLQLVGRGVQAQWSPHTDLVSTDRFNLYRTRADGSNVQTAASKIAQLIQVDTSPKPDHPYYHVTAVDASGNESEPSLRAYLNVSLLPVPSLTVTQSGNDYPVVQWEPVTGNIAGYYLFQGQPPQQTKLNAGQLLTSTTYTDSGYTSTADRTYAVVTVDANQVESPARSITLPSISATLDSSARIRRGEMNRLNFTVKNSSPNTVENACISVLLAGTEHRSSNFNLTAGLEQIVPVIVGGYASLTEVTTPAVTTLEITPAAGEKVQIIREQTVPVIEGGLQLDLRPGDFQIGSQGKAQFRIANTSSETIEIITGKGQGAQASPEVRFILLDAEDNVLATQSFKAITGAEIVSLPNGESVMRLPAGYEYLSPETSIPVPAGASKQLQLRLEIDHLYYHRAQPDEVVLSGLTTRSDVTAGVTSYIGEITAITPGESSGDEDIVITGHAITRADLQPRPDSLLMLYITKDGFERSYPLVTDATGLFSHTFKPNLGERGGRYEVRVLHPDILDRSSQGSFVIKRLSVTPTSGKLRASWNRPQTVFVTAATSPEMTVHNLRLELVAEDQPGGILPVGVTVEPAPAVTQIASGQSASISATITAGANAANEGTLILRVVSDESGPNGWQKITIQTRFGEGSPLLRSTPTYVNTGVSPGGTVLETIRLENPGLALAKKLNFSIKNTDGTAAPAWAAVTTASGIDLSVGGALSADVSFTPPESVTQGDYFFILRTEGENVTPLDVGIHVVVTQAGEGSVRFKVRDAFSGTLNAQGEIIHGVQGASIDLQNENVLSIQRNVVADSRGEVTLSGLPAGSYQYRVNGNKHITSTGRFWIRPGVTLEQDVALQYNPVTIEWAVVPITIRDHYNIVLNTTFETDVPSPVVVMDPPAINLPRMAKGEVLNGSFKITNHGLIRADDLQIGVPESDAQFKVEMMTGIPTSLEAGETVQVAYRMTALKDFGKKGPASQNPQAENQSSIESQASLNAEHLTVTNEEESTAECMEYIKIIPVTFTFECANGLRFSFTTLLPFFGSYGDCGANPGSLVTWNPTAGNNRGSSDSNNNRADSDPVGTNDSNKGEWGLPDIIPDIKIPIRIPDYSPLPIPDPECYPKVSYGSPLFTIEWAREDRYRVGCSVSIMNRHFEDDLVDMSVSVPGHRNQTVPVSRQLRDGEWIFFPKLKFKTDPVTNDQTYSEVEWQEFRFFQADYKRKLFRSGTVSIAVDYDSVDAHARMTLADNSWMVFDKNGNLRSAGRNDGVTYYTLNYDSEGRRQNVKSGTKELLTYTWNDKRLVNVADAENRQVRYSYTSGLLTEVTGPDGAKTRYEYDAYKRLKRITDSTGKSHSLNYRRNQFDPAMIAAGEKADGEVLSILDDEGHGRYFDFGLDSSSGDRYGRIRSSDGVIDEQWFYEDGQLKEWRRNGKIVKKVNKIVTETEEESDLFYRFSFVGCYWNGRGSSCISLFAIIPYPPKIWRAQTLEITDSRGHMRVEEYTALGQLKKVTNPDESFQTFEYDANTHLLTRSINENGVVSELHYDGSRNLVRFDEAVETELARTTEYSYDGSGRPLSVNAKGKDASPDRLSTLIYNENGDLEKTINPLNYQQEIISRSLGGNVLRQKDARDQIWNFTYDDRHRVETITDPESAVTRFELDAFNNLTSITSPSGRLVTTTYDINNQPLTTTDAGGHTSTNLYTADGRLAKSTDADGKSVFYEYDDQGRLKRKRDEVGNETVYHYNPETADTAPDSITYPTFTRSFSYNERGLVETSVDTLAGGQTVTTQFTYSPTGALLSKVDGEGHRTNYEYDELDRATAITQVGVGTSRMTYDVHNNVTVFTNPNGKHWRYRYDAAGQLLEEETPLGKITRFEYDGVGNLETITRPNGARIKRTFDSQRRVLTVAQFPPGSESPSKTVTYTRDEDGRIKTYADGTTSGTYLYNDVGRLTSETVNYGSFSITQSYSYNANGTLKTYTSPAGTVSTYAYDAGNRLLSMNVSGVGDFTINSYLSNAVTKVTLPGGTTQDFTRDSYLRPTLITSSSTGGGNLLNLSLGYSPLGNVVSRNDGTGNKTLEYDAARRLKKGVTGNYTYDSNGNRLTDSSTGDTVWQYDDDDHLLNDAANTYDYNANGALITKTTPTGTWTFSYDHDGRLTQVTKGADVFTYGYGPDGQRLFKTVNGVTTYFAYSAFGLCAEYSANGTLLREYGYSPVSGQGAAPAYVKQGSGTYFYHTDQIGTPLRLTDANGTVVWSGFYNDFGHATIGINTVENPFRFPGQYHDGETGLHYNWNRYYDPENGRYISKDPVRDGANFYAYAGSNPFAFTDPDGLRILKGLALIVGGFIPYVGDALDAETLIDPNASDLDKQIAAGSLAANATTVGLAPNVGPMVRGAREILGDSKDIAKNADDVVDMLKGGDNVATNGAGRGKNKLEPDPKAEGDHSVFQRGEDERVFKYETYEQTKSGHMNPVKRYDGGNPDGSPGAPHFNKKTGVSVPTPHVQGKNIPGGARPPNPEEIPR